MKDHDRSFQKFGLSCAISTPIRPDGGPDLERLVRHARWVLANGADLSVTLFGTTGEGASLGLTTRQSMINALLEAKIRINPST